ncbi:hypothetical protein SYNPS1DRAFT_25728 [Syncephalis pseudoplumigaleata]|uniref:NET domain-containing protein n=1 Tax=Syncephalis pseudoplumigaleata TaxID=1712513 RepID=A0A4P9YRY1_9FUNG|nr:hypothetical protein SYNPS1DRAFT_25728 [Syncephalis pseudoplumigaleata]|eukprot:RKP22504.1 hypothetical protein SYNPS1DRAFT_25728 [Syncephalis pseudoplumigaleata]
MERHLEFMSRKLESMKKTASGKDRRRKSKTSADLRTKRNRYPAAEEEASSHATGAATAGTRRKPAAKRKPGTKRPRVSYSSSDDDNQAEVTLDQKRELSENINLLSGDKLTTVVAIIQQSVPSLKDATGEEEIELDIDSLDAKTLRKLYRFVMKNTKKKTSRKSRQVSEEEQNRKINQLESKLRQFDDTSMAGSSSA